MHAGCQRKYVMYNYGNVYKAGGFLLKPCIVSTGVCCCSDCVYHVLFQSILQEHRVQDWGRPISGSSSISMSCTMRIYHCMRLCPIQSAVLKISFVHSEKMGVLGGRCKCIPMWLRTGERCTFRGTGPVRGGWCSGSSPMLCSGLLAPGWCEAHTYYFT